MFYFVLFARRFHKPNFSPNNQMYSQRLDFEYGKKRLEKLEKMQVIQTINIRRKKNTNDTNVITTSTEAAINQNRNCHMLPCC